MTFDPIKFERAILIKNNKGDWGIVMAHWEGFQRGIAPKGVGKYYTLHDTYVVYSTCKHW